MRAFPAITPLQILALIPLSLLYYLALDYSLYALRTGVFADLTLLRKWSEYFGIGSFLIALFFAALTLRFRPFALMFSVARRVRIGFLVRCLVLASCAHLLAISFDMFTRNSVQMHTFFANIDRVNWTQAATVLGVLLLASPLQVVSEEVLFRATIPQMIGRWISHPIPCFALGAAPFVLLHNYDWAASIIITLWAAIFAFLTWRTGGIEAAICFHLVNNVIVAVFDEMHFPSFVTDINGSFSTTTRFIHYMIFELIVIAIYLVGVEILFRTMRARGQIARFAAITTTAPVFLPSADAEMKDSENIEQAQPEPLPENPPV